MADEFVAVLKDHPLTRTIGVVSPGGYVLEAQAIAAEIMARGLDTYAPERCASACVDLFAAGERRWATSRSMFGLHRSGNECMPDNGPTREDRRDADFLRQRGVAESFIQQALDTPHDGIWRPDTRTVLDSHLATGLR
jgi:hypothetical protein